MRTCNRDLVVKGKNDGADGKEDESGRGGGSQMPLEVASIGREHSKPEALEVKCQPKELFW